MPHFIVDCSENVLSHTSEKEVIDSIFEVAKDTGLFDVEDIKVRLRSFKIYRVGAGDPDFIHVFGHIMEGRTPEQKSNLSKRIVEKLKKVFPKVPVISMNVSEFEKSNYNNLKTI